jgi:hypothetical protein
MSAIAEKYRFNKYGLAEYDIRIIFFKYYELTTDDLKKYDIIKAIEDYFKKWCRKIPTFRDLRKNLHEQIKNKDYSEKDILNIYRDYIEFIYTEAYALNKFNRDKSTVRISSKIVGGIQKYYDHHY